MPHLRDLVSIYRAKVVKTAEYYAKEKHQGQKYDKYDYFECHILSVVDVLFEVLFETNYIDYETHCDDLESLFAACYLHDVIEDCNVTYNDLVGVVGVKVADIVYDVTSELGKNRKERNEKTYPKIYKNPAAQIVKLCDRIANTENRDSSMYEKYKKENPAFLSGIINTSYATDFHKLIIDNLVIKLQKNFE